MALDEGHERAIRLKQLRNMAGFSSIKAFSEATNLPYGTIKSWEAGTYKTLTSKGAVRIAEVMATMAIHVSPTWLLYGTGHPPINSNETTNSLDGNNFVNSYRKLLQTEISNFIEQFENSVFYEIVDDSMQPHFQPGDTLFGLWLYGEDIKLLNEKNCLIETKDKQIICRKLFVNQTDASYDICASNPTSTTLHRNTAGITLDKAAAIIKIWQAIKQIVST